MNDIKRLVNSWIEHVFGPLYHISLNIRFSSHSSKDMYTLITDSPQTFFRILARVLGSEIIAESLIATLAAYAEKLGLKRPPTRDELISWFKNDDIEKVRKFINLLLDITDC